MAFEKLGWKPYNPGDKVTPFNEYSADEYMKAHLDYIPPGMSANPHKTTDTPERQKELTAQGNKVAPDPFQAKLDEANAKKEIGMRLGFRSAFMIGARGLEGSPYAISARNRWWAGTTGQLPAAGQRDPNDKRPPASPVPPGRRPGANAPDGTIAPQDPRLMSAFGGYNESGDGGGGGGETAGRGTPSGPSVPSGPIGGPRPPGTGTPPRNGPPKPIGYGVYDLTRWVIGANGLAHPRLAEPAATTNNTTEDPLGFVGQTGQTVQGFVPGNRAGGAIPFTGDPTKKVMSPLAIDTTGGQTPATGILSSPEQAANTAGNTFLTSENPDDVLARISRARRLQGMSR